MYASTGDDISAPAILRGADGAAGKKRPIGGSSGRDPARSASTEGPELTRFASITEGQHAR